MEIISALWRMITLSSQLALVDSNSDSSSHHHCKFRLASLLPNDLLRPSLGRSWGSPAGNKSEEAVYICFAVMGIIIWERAVQLLPSALLLGTAKQPLVETIYIQVVLVCSSIFLRDSRNMISALEGVLLTIVLFVSFSALPQVNAVSNGVARLPGGCLVSPSSHHH